MRRPGRPVFHTLADGSSSVYFPIDDGSRTTGVVEIALRPMSEREVRLAQGLLRILRNQIALPDYGERDTLTGLLNRKTFKSRFERLCEELPPTVPLQSQAHSWLGLLDIDRFKSINDTYGHVFGDEVLLLVSQIMQSTLRSEDQLFRFGGEEFVVVLEGFARLALAKRSNESALQSSASVSRRWLVLPPVSVSRPCGARTAHRAVFNVPTRRCTL